jgi:hypothetical protein
VLVARRPLDRVRDLPIDPVGERPVSGGTTDPGKRTHHKGTKTEEEDAETRPFFGDSSPISTKSVAGAKPFCS